eukprot:scaffold144406_cov18-Tisochrysis_lutea.AAC.2
MRGERAFSSLHLTANQHTSGNPERLVSSALFNVHLPALSCLACFMPTRANPFMLCLFDAQLLLLSESMLVGLSTQT